MSNEANTKPTLDTILERLVSMEERLSERINALGKDVTGLRAEVGELRNDMNAALRKVEDKIDVLNQNILDTRADYRDLRRHVEDLEKNVA
jgi:hypothetical protein